MKKPIEIHPDVCNGKAIIAGTRITVSTILGYLSAGDSIEDIVVAYPQLTQEHILACLDYARAFTETDSLIAMAK